MSRSGLYRGVASLALAPILLSVAGAARPERPVPRVTPKFDPVAETSLLMDGLNQANYRSLEKLLKQKPADADTWSFVRGQSLLIAETGNLLLLRPPRSGGADAWNQDAMDLRVAAASLARKAGDRDYEGSVAGLGKVASVCNRCHETFRVATHVGPDAGAD
ncbi:MAG TPA: hypothetical protein DDY78_28295 [Planctomycetales bacterium]|jgi:hypothetical protein|nr:hypothetical protein [Planctomycetales bacterium]